MARPLGVQPIAARDAHGLFAEPAQEFAAVDDLAARLADRFSHLERHEQSKILLVLLHEVEGPAQDVAAGTGRSGRPLLLSGDGRVERADAVVRRCIGDAPDDGACRRVVHREGSTALCLDPFAVDEEPGGDAVEQGLLIGCRDAHVRSFRGRRGLR